MTTLNENAWNPINLSNTQRGGYSIDNYAVSTSWYNRVIEDSGTRYNRLLKYHEADCESVEISRALDIIAEDISSCNADDQDTIRLEFDEDSKIKKTQISVLNGALKVWKKRTGFDMKLFDRVRYTIKMGAMFFTENADGTLKHLPTERFVGYILSEEDENVITHYLYDPNLGRIDKRDRTYIKKHGNNTSHGDNYEIIPIDDLMIMKVGDEPFGCSLISKVYKVWKQMSLLEDAIIIYRVVRAPERRVYYIDTGNLQGPKREQAIEKQRMRLAQKQVSRNNAVEVEYDPHSTSENIFIPTNSSGKGSRVETLPAGQNLGEITDLEWFAKKMAAGLRIPTSMVDINEQQQNQFSDMRVGQMYQIEMRYMGHIKRMKTPIAYVLGESFARFCEKREIVIPDEMTLVINDSMSFALYKEMEVNQTLLNVFSSTLQINSLSKRFSLQKFMNMDIEELRDNELYKLREKGLSDQEIKELPDNVIENIVYGDGRLGKEYGIEPADGSGGW